MFTIPVLIVLVYDIVSSLRRGEVGLDIVAALSMAAALVVGEELAAARLAGLQVVLAVRSERPAPPGLGADQIIRTFADLG